MSAKLYEQTKMAGDLLKIGLTVRRQPRPMRWDPSRTYYAAEDRRRQHRSDAVPQRQAVQRLSRGCDPVHTFVTGRLLSAPAPAPRGGPSSNLTPSPQGSLLSNPAPPPQRVQSSDSAPPPKGGVSSNPGPSPQGGPSFNPTPSPQGAPSSDTAPPPQGGLSSSLTPSSQGGSLSNPAPSPQGARHPM